MARLQKENFDVGKEITALVEKSRGTGGIVTFLGTVRDISKGHEIVKINFESYANMAEKELDRLEADAKEKFDIIDSLVIHRTGEITVGENIVLIVVTSAHRSAAFDACEWTIDELKKRIPIWKEEFTSTGKHWVEEHP
ncbi:Molybdopterin synthase catalytic subunit MoaE [hydrothermal vent metagenome]|uniref:Molybdopterin synthase catalytic subunit MoaE n=1 Tax=hydrothermal vent metagenome TaxID=652676 RepID=A0A3B1CQJ6_9ZZZZ